MQKLSIMENLSIQSEEILNAENQNAEGKEKKIIPQNSEKGKKIIAKDQKKKDDLSKINFSKFAEGLKDIKIIEKKEREDLYIYPDEMKGNKDIINSSIGKNWRNKRRGDMQRLCNAIFASYKMKDEKGLKIALKNFDDNYKSFYRMNDYSLKSISQSNDAGKNKNIEFGLEMIKELKGLNKKK